MNGEADLRCLNFSMYKICRMYEFPETFETLTCMYEMKNVVESNISALPSKESNLNQLESRQERLFRQLEELTGKLELIKQQISLDPTLIEPRSKISAKTKLENGVEQVSDVVVTTSSSYNPITLLMIYYLLNEKRNVRLTCHIHSSVVSLTSEYQMFVQNIVSKYVKEQNLNLVLIWKDVGTDMQFVVSPTIQGAVIGEVNFLRYCASNFLQNLSFKDPIRATQIDQWLDFVHFSLLHGSSKERQGVLRTLNSHLGKEDYLVGGRFSLADVAMFGALLQTQVASFLQGNVKKWAKMCAMNCSISKALNDMSIVIDGNKSCI